MIACAASYDGPSGEPNRWTAHTMNGRFNFLAGVLCYSLTGAALFAQDVATGLVLDSRFLAPLSCVDVEVLNSAGNVVTRTRTDDRGLFQAEAPAGGDHRVRFRIFNYAPVVAPLAAPDSSGTQVPVYHVAFEEEQNSSSSEPAESDSASDAPPRAHPVRHGLRYPDTLLRSGIEGGAVIQFVVNANGRVEPESIRPLSATRKEFAESAIRYVRSDARFTPARRAGRATCALLQAPFDFLLGGKRPRSGRRPG